LALFGAFLGVVKELKKPTTIIKLVLSLYGYGLT
jgi:hypothetical protein